MASPSTSLPFLPFSFLTLSQPSSPPSVILLFFFLLTPSFLFFFFFYLSLSVSPLPFPPLSILPRPPRCVSSKLNLCSLSRRVLHMQKAGSCLVYACVCVVCRRHIWGMGLGWNTSDYMTNGEWKNAPRLPPLCTIPSPQPPKPSSCRCCYCHVDAPSAGSSIQNSLMGSMSLLSFRGNFECSFQQHIMYHQSRD